MMMSRAIFRHVQILCFILLLFISLSGVRGSGECRRTSNSLTAARDEAGPYFDRQTPSNISAQLGSTALLPCIVRQLNATSVSWLRSLDSQIVTVDQYTFIGDQRFSSLFWPDADTWSLQIRHVKSSDAGLYECQVNAETKICHIISLNVIVPRVQIVNDRDGNTFVNLASTVRLRCVVSRTLENPAFVFWLRNNQRLVPTGSAAAGAAAAADGSGELAANRQLSARLRIEVQRPSPEITRSILIITDVQPADMGNYTCQPSSLPSDSTHLHVLNGEHRAAMQDGVSGGFPSGPAGRLWLMCCLLLQMFPALN